MLRTTLSIIASLKMIAIYIKAFLNVNRHLIRVEVSNWIICQGARNTPPSNGFPWYLQVVRHGVNRNVIGLSTGTEDSPQH
jgi:hypothetical protein